MKLSDIKGERSLDIVADAMELAELIADDERFKAFAENLKALDGDTDGAWVVFCKHWPSLLRDERYKSRIVSILAAAANVPTDEYAENGAVLQDLFELLTSDTESLGFLAGAAARTV